MNARRVSVAARGRVQRRLPMLAVNLAGIAAIAMYARGSQGVTLDPVPLSMLLATLP